MPELGLPQLVAHLRGRGLRAEQLDLNRIFYGSFLKESALQDGLRHRFDSRIMRSPESAGVELEGIPLHQSGRKDGKRLPDAYGSHFETYGRLLGIDSASWKLDDVIHAIEREDPLYEEFYHRYIDRKAAAADWVGFSILTREQVPPALYFARRIKQLHPGKKVCLGGSWCTASYAVLDQWGELFRYVDYVVVHNGEKAMETLLSRGRPRSGVGDISNLAYRSDGAVRRNPLDLRQDFEAAEPPVFDGYDLASYPTKGLPYQTTRGCEWDRCVFCYHRFPGVRLRSKSAGTIVDHLEHLRDKYRVGNFWLADLSTPMEVMDELSKELIRRNTGILWAALARADKPYSPAFARQLKKSGCEGLHFGLETTSAEGLAKLQKGLDVKVFESTVTACAAARIGVGTFVLNYPSQTKEEFEATIDFVLRRAPDIMAMEIARFELGRSSKAMRDPGRLGVSLPPDIDKDISSFSLPHRADVILPPREFLRIKENALKKFALMRRKSRLLLISPPKAFVGPTRARPKSIPRAQPSVLSAVARFYSQQKAFEVEIVDCGSGGSEGLSMEGLRKRIEGLRPDEIYIDSPAVHERAPLHELVRACRGLWPAAPITLGGPCAIGRPRRALSSGADRIFCGLLQDGAADGRKPS